MRNLKIIIFFSILLTIQGIFAKDCSIIIENKTPNVTLTYENVVINPGTTSSQISFPCQTSPVFKISAAELKERSVDFIEYNINSTSLIKNKPILIYPDDFVKVHQGTCDCDAYDTWHEVSCIACDAQHTGSK